VNSISPSIVASAMTENFSTYFSEDLKMHATFPRRPAAPSEIIPTVLYLIENEFVNGKASLIVAPSLVPITESGTWLSCWALSPGIDIKVDGGWRLVTSKPSQPDGTDPRELAPGLE
jgi:hypothetical protein